jgi:nicotinamide phosphoribosyltransferase
MKRNLILKSDSYKYSHFKAFVPGMTRSHYYLEPRGGDYEDIVFFGLQYYLKEYLTTPIIQDNIEEADKFCKMHGIPFHRAGWQHVLDKHTGLMPVKIRAVPEGTVVPNHNVLMTVENTCPECYWVPGFLETLLEKVWYPTTVASRDRFIHKMILSYLEKSADDPKAEIDFKLHSFGYRGVSSEESAGIAGAAELLHFRGSDTIEGVRYANHYYHCDIAGFSIPATEHSVMTSFGKEHEAEAISNFLDVFAKPGALIACVCDSYDLWNAVGNIVGTQLKDKIIKSGATLVVRPDSGNPPEIVLKTAQLLDEKFGHTINKKGYKVLNTVRIIQGDGINENSIRDILENLVSHGYSATNIAFGMGGGRIQEMTRDTLKFAYKLSWAEIDGVGRDIKKDPITDPGKASKAGRLDLVSEYPGKFQTIKLPDNRTGRSHTVMRTVYDHGKILVEEDLETIRKRTCS